MRLHRHRGRPRVHRLVHQRAHRGLARRRRRCAARAEPRCRRSWCRARRRSSVRPRRGPRPHLHGGRLRMARCRLLAVHRAQRRSAGAGRALRLDLEPQLPRAAGHRRPHAPDEPGHGGGRGADRPAHRRAHAAASEVDDGAVSRARQRIAVPIDEANVDTNQLCPTRFNKVPRGPGYERILFHDRRFDAEGNEKPISSSTASLIASARIIVADRNFGCGSSRESAVYALHEFGVRCVIAPSFGDIFASNCLKNGLLPVRVPAEVAADMRRQLHAQRRRDRHRRSGAADRHRSRRAARTASTSTRCASAACSKGSTTSR